MKNSSSVLRANAITPHFRSLELPFTLKNTEIDYFHIEPDILSHGEELMVTEENINLRPGEYLNLEQHFHSLDDSVQETIVLNVPVGHGKTTLCYKLIRKYYDEGYHIIVCSPFQKLVEKDHAALKKEIPNALIFNYKELDFNETTFGGSFIQHLAEAEARIHIMTINCLLKNPGDERYEQAFHKSRFLQKLKNSIRNKGEKIVFFFDEIHESVGNFKNEFIPNLTTWRGLTHKCFVSSATFTSASIPVIRYISYLTGGRMKVYFTPRIKSTRQANLHLHLTDNAYSSNYLYPLNKVIEIIRGRPNGTKVNILCAYKAIAKALTNSNSNNSITQSVLSLNPNVCTSESNQEFDPEANNVGTNFKTGVNISNSNAILIVILPTVNKSNPFTSYGIFSDGIPAVVQSLARLRNGGNIHVFMHAPDTILDLESHISNLPNEILQGKLNRPFKKVNESYAWMKQKYETLKKFVQHEVDFLVDVLNEHEELSYHYPTFQEVLVEKSQNYLLSKNEWMGKFISPYLLWAAINNQFCNTTLRSITYQTKSFRTVKLTNENIQSEIFSLLSRNTITVIRNESVRKGFDTLIEALAYSTEDTGISAGEITNQHLVNDFYLNDKEIKYSKLRAERSFNYSLLRILVQIKAPGMELEKGNYIRTCISNALSFETRNEPTSQLHRLYRNLHLIKELFLEIINTTVVNYKNRLILHPRYAEGFSDNFVKRTIELIYKLKEEDKFLKAFTFIHNHKSVLDGERITLSMKKTIVNELEGIFLNLSNNRLLYEGIKHYIVDQQIENQSIIPNLNFLE